MEDSPAGVRRIRRTSPRSVPRRLQKKTDDLDDEYTVIAIDQTRQEITTDLVHAWFPEGERPTLPVSGAWESLKLLGGVTAGGDTFFLKCEDNFTADITTRLLDALQTKFGEKICVVLDNAPYFAANDVHDYAENTLIELCHLPRGSPELNPAEGCWQKLNQRLGNQLFEELDELREAVFDALASIEPPNIYNYLCP